MAWKRTATPLVVSTMAVTVNSDGRDGVETDVRAVFYVDGDKNGEQ